MPESNLPWELIAGTGLLTATIFAHGVGLRFIGRWFHRAWSENKPFAESWRADLILTCVVASLAVLHLLEPLLWAVPIYVSGILPSLRDAYYFVLQSYTTLGAGNVTLPENWRLFGPVIAISGLFAFGWTASVLVTVMAEFVRFSRK
ncbi:ion channel [Aestuariivirga sp.]|uniref:ion channel n=1 Tax=Aestuariivirga sp. TaxID=2650926 RepID=UPI0039E403EB